MIDEKLKFEIERISEAKAEETYRRLGTRFGMAENPRHIHNGLDSPNIPFSSLSPFTERFCFTIYGTDAATATNYGVFWVAPAVCRIVGVKEVHQTKGTDAGTVSLQVEKLSDGTAPGAGINILQSAFSLKTTNNTIQEADMVITSTNGRPDASMQKNERLCLVDAGTLTAVANVTVQILINYQN